MVRPRSAGVEHAGLWAMQQLGFGDLLDRLSCNGPLRTAAMGSIIGRMALPGSERATWRWLCELMGVYFEAMNMMRIYRAADALLPQRHNCQCKFIMLNST